MALYLCAQHAFGFERRLQFALNTLRCERRLWFALNTLRCERRLWFALKTPSAVSVQEISEGTTLKALRQAQDKLRVMSDII